MKILIPLKNRGFSGAYEDNVLLQDDVTFVMDNHRLALWSWFQVLEKNQRYNLLHIDAHPDLSESGLKDFNHDLWSMSLSDYREAWQTDINLPLFRWDNYLEIFLKNYPEMVGLTVSATHHLGSSKELSKEIKSYDLAKYVRGVFSEDVFENDLPWIVNLDLDYFFSAAPMKLELFSQDFVESLAHSFSLGLKNNMIKAFTISLSPECCGSWENSEKILHTFQVTFGNALHPQK